MLQNLTAVSGSELVPVDDLPCRAVVIGDGVILLEHERRVFEVYEVAGGWARRIARSDRVTDVLSALDLL